MEDTQTKGIAQDNEALIQEMLRGAKPTEIEDVLSKNPIIHKGDADQPAPMVVSKISSAGYVYIWETDTFAKVPCLYYMLPSKLRSRRPDGSYRFTTIDPGQKPKLGNIKCSLHKDAQNRKHYAELGFRTCPKATLNSPYQLEQHMKKRHPQEWAAIEQERTRQEKEEDRALQRLILKGMLPLQPVEVTQTIPFVEKETETIMYTCSKCNKPHMFTSKLGQEHLEYKS